MNFSDNQLQQLRGLLDDSLDPIKISIQSLDSRLERVETRLDTIETRIDTIENNILQMLVFFVVFILNVSKL